MVLAIQQPSIGPWHTKSSSRKENAGNGSPVLCQCSASLGWAIKGAGCTMMQIRKGGKAHKGHEPKA